MRRVLVIGSGGAGKSTFAARLGGRTGLPVIHLDSLYWRAGWRETPRGEWAARVEELLRGDAWIMDGNYGGTLERRLAACDTVVFLDPPRAVCLWRVIKRRALFRGRARPDMNEGCRERLTWEFVRWVWTYPRARRPGVLEKLSRLDGGKRVFHLRSQREVEGFLERAGSGGDGGPR
jgi:adenylate kinase family enzyme